MSSSTSSINSVWSMEGFEEESESDDETVMTSMAKEEKLKAQKVKESLKKQANTPIIIISAA